MPDTEQVDAINIDALQQQDEQSFKALVKMYHQRLLMLANSIVGESVGEEVVQDAWIAIYQNLPTFEQRSSLKTWLYRITSNKAISRLRKEKKSVNFSQLETQADDPEVDVFDQTGHWQKPTGHWQLDQPDQLLFSQELQQCMQTVLQALPQLQQAIFLLTDMEGEKSEDVCNNLDISASNMRVLLHRARFKLYQHINNFQETGEC